MVDQLLEFGPGQRDLQVLGARRVGRDKRQVNVGRRRLRQILLGPLGGFFQALQRHLIFAQIDPVAFLEFIRDVVDEDLVEIIATQVGVAVGRLHFKDTIAYVQD